MQEILYKKEFKYSHDNPYHFKLLDNYSDFVICDNDGECNLGLWNKNIFNNNNPLNVEVGSGYGHFMIDYCEKNPNENFIGIDFRFKRSFNLARKLRKVTNSNFRYLRARGERIEFLFGENEVDKLYYFFPDPWPKKRQNKNRLFQAPFLNAAYKILKPGGKIYIKTDHDDYAKWMKDKIENDNNFSLSSYSMDLWNDKDDSLDGKFLKSFETKFEKIFIKQNINIKTFVLETKKHEQ